MNEHFWFQVSRVCILLLFALCSCGAGSGGSNSNTVTPNSSPMLISTDRTTYKPDDVILVSVVNHLPTSIFALDTRASCSILDLQVQDNGRWQDTSTAHCSLGRAAMWVEIAAGKVYTATISAGSQGLKNMLFPPGTYRLLLSYSTSATPQERNSTMTTISSSPLVVASS